MALIPVYPARHPLFAAVCADCGKLKDSPGLYADTEGEPFKAYVCVKCVFTFRRFSSNKMQELEIERDSREMKNYGSFSS